MNIYNILDSKVLTISFIVSGQKNVEDLFWMLLDALNAFDCCSESRGFGWLLGNNQIQSRVLVLQFLLDGVFQSSQSKNNASFESNTKKGANSTIRHPSFNTSSTSRWSPSCQGFCCLVEIRNYLQIRFLVNNTGYLS